MKDFGNVKIHITETYEDMCSKATDIFCEELKINPAGVFGFATGSTPIGMYEELIKRYENNAIDFSEMKTFNLDEYYPIKKSNNQSYDYYMKENLFNHINVKEENINIPNGEAESFTEECENYEGKIKKAGGIDLQILGMGENGHIGFNEPGDSFTKATNYVYLTESTITANARFFDSIDEVPKNALTMGIGSIMQAKKLLLLVNSAKKANILKEALFGDITPKIPASVVQLHRNVNVVITKDVADILFS